MSRNKAETNTP